MKVIGLNIICIELYIRYSPKFYTMTEFIIKLDVGEYPILIGLAVSYLADE
jgi:hypothetical protein